MSFGSGMLVVLMGYGLACVVVGFFMGRSTRMINAGGYPVPASADRQDKARPDGKQPVLAEQDPFEDAVIDMRTTRKGISTVDGFDRSVIV